MRFAKQSICEKSSNVGVLQPCLWLYTDRGMLQECGQVPMGRQL